MKVLLTDHDLLDVSLERDIFRQAGIEMLEAQCRTEQEVIDAAHDCRALMLACIRNVVRYDHDIDQGRWHYTSERYSLNGENDDKNQTFPMY